MIPHARKIRSEFELRVTFQKDEHSPTEFVVFISKSQQVEIPTDPAVDLSALILSKNVLSTNF